MVATDPGSGFLTGDSGEETLPRLVFGVAGGCGVGGQVSPAKLALADALDGVDDRFELRIHGVGGSSAEQMLGQVETVQVGGDDTAQFLRRVAVARQPAVMSSPRHVSGAPARCMISLETDHDGT